jgi:hypothetical protein
MIIHKSIDVYIIYKLDYIILEENKQTLSLDLFVLD